MNIQTFGSIEKYKMLEFLTNQISLLNNREREYISSVIIDFNTLVKKSDMIKDKSFKNYILDLIHNDFLTKTTNHLEKVYSKDIVTHLKNYFFCKN